MTAFGMGYAKREMKMSNSFGSWICRTAIAALGFVAIGTSADAADSVKLRLDWVFGSEHAPIFLALEKGFFKEEGIEVELLPGEGSSVTTKLVGNRDADFGYASADQVLLGASRDLPVVATAVLLQQNPTAFIFKTSQNIKNVETDLYGKTLGIQLKSSTGRQWDAIKKTLNLDPAKLTEVPADGALVSLIAADRIDVGVGFYFNDALKLKATGEDVSWILLEELGMKMYSTTLLTNAELIAENPDLVARFTKAFVRGWEYSVANPDEAYEAFVKANPSTDKVYAKLKLPEVLKLTQSPDVSANGLGSSTLAGWDELQKQLVEMGLLKTSIDVSKAFTNQFLK
ncbi:Putative thiamine biosynthesis protein (plasmid) [Aminobacter sp. MSH1]|nr:Putative thiamine biosynthesis protein [Aminobacter sp. MSH1]